MGGEQADAAGPGETLGGRHTDLTQAVLLLRPEAKLIPSLY